mmetsp:Transcript_121337/g.387827  ORF Transcript_121337/g.387827 Transcript_121337/m.387827 type:complete len:248 (-) Transcript_121337:404-1147(-)
MELRLSERMTGLDGAHSEGPSICVPADALNRSALDEEHVVAHVAISQDRLAPVELASRYGGQELLAALLRQALRDPLRDAPPRRLREKEQRKHAEGTTEDDAKDPRGQHETLHLLELLLLHAQPGIGQPETVREAFDETLKRDPTRIADHLTHSCCSQGGQGERDADRVLDRTADGEHDHVIEEAEADEGHRAPDVQAPELLPCREGHLFLLHGRDGFLLGVLPGPGPLLCRPRVHRGGDAPTSGGV